MEPTTETPVLTARERDRRDRARFHGLRIMDATTPYEFTVISADIRRGQPGTRCHCAAAVTVKRDPRVLMVSINPRDAWIVFADDPDTIQRYSLDTRMRNAIRTFDDEKMEVVLVASWAHGTTFTLHPPKGSTAAAYRQPSKLRPRQPRQGKPTSRTRNPSTR